MKLFPYAIVALLLATVVGVHYAMRGSPERELTAPGELAFEPPMDPIAAASAPRFVQQGECAWTTRAFGTAPYVVMIGDSAVAGFQRWDTALRRAVTEESADPRRDVQIRMAVRVECPTGGATGPGDPPPLAVVDSVVTMDVFGVRNPVMKVGVPHQMCARVYWSDGKLEDTCAVGAGLNFQEATRLRPGMVRTAE